MPVQLSEERVALIAKWHALDKECRKTKAQNEMNLVRLRKCDLYSKEEDELMSMIFRGMDEVSEQSEQMDLLNQKISKLSSIENTIDTHIEMGRLQQEAQQQEAQQQEAQQQEAQQQEAQQQQTIAQRITRPKLEIVPDEETASDLFSEKLIGFDLIVIPDGEPMPEDDPTAA